MAGGRLPWFGENEVFFIWSQQLKRFCQFQLCPCVCMISAYFTDWRSFKPVEVELELWQGVTVPGSGNGVTILEAILGIYDFTIYPSYVPDLEWRFPNQLFRRRGWQPQARYKTGKSYFITKNEKNISASKIISFHFMSYPIHHRNKQSLSSTCVGLEDTPLWASVEEASM